jgi:hypothetical protein
MAYSRALRLAQIARPRRVSLRRVPIFSIESQTEAERLWRGQLSAFSQQLSVSVLPGIRILLNGPNAGEMLENVQQFANKTLPNVQSLFYEIHRNVQVD